MKPANFDRKEFTLGPHRIVHNSKGYLTETVYDEAPGRFVERPFPPMTTGQVGVETLGQTEATTVETDCPRERAA